MSVIPQSSYKLLAKYFQYKNFKNYIYILCRVSKLRTESILDHTHPPRGLLKPRAQSILLFTDIYSVGKDFFLTFKFSKVHFLE